MAKKKFDYFRAFEKQAEIAVQEAEALVEAIASFTTAVELQPTLSAAHKIEQAGDEENHKILRSVAVDFITPIDREDIIDLAQRLDTVIDNIEGVIQCFFMYDVHEMHEGAEEFADLIQKSTEALLQAIGDFRDFKKSSKFREAIEEVNAFEEQGDELYLNKIRELYTVERESVIRVEVWARIFDRMEATLDSCEHVADTMSDVMLKNM